MLHYNRCKWRYVGKSVLSALSAFLHERILIYFKSWIRLRFQTCSLELKHGRNMVVTKTELSLIDIWGFVHATRRADLPKPMVPVCCWSAWAAGRLKNLTASLWSCTPGLNLLSECVSSPHPTLCCKWSSPASRWLWKHDNCLEIQAQLHWLHSFQEVEDEMMVGAQCVTLANSHLFLSFSENDGFIWLTEICSRERVFFPHHSFSSDYCDLQSRSGVRRKLIFVTFLIQTAALVPFCYFWQWFGILNLQVCVISDDCLQWRGAGISNRDVSPERHVTCSNQCVF